MTPWPVVMRVLMLVSVAALVMRLKYAVVHRSWAELTVELVAGTGLVLVLTRVGNLSDLTPPGDPQLFGGGSGSGVSW